MRLTGRWVEAIADTLGLDTLESRILALALYYKVDRRIERLFDAINECRGGPSRFQRNAGLIALLLQVPSAEVETRLTGGAKLLASGLLQLERDGGLDVLERLKSLIRQGMLPASDFYDQLLGAAAAAPLAWESFAHLAKSSTVSPRVTSRWAKRSPARRSWRQGSSPASSASVIGRSRAPTCAAKVAANTVLPVPGGP